MKLESVIARLEQIRVSAENGEYQEFSEGYTEKLIVQTLIEFIGNKKVEDKINEIPF
jgi:hypothetical protein